MNEAPQLTQAQRLEGISGVVAAIAGLTSIGLHLFAPLATVTVAGAGGDRIEHLSYWQVYAGFIHGRLGLIALFLCLVSLLAIAYGAYIHSVRQAARGRIVLWSGTALLAVVLALALPTLHTEVAGPMGLVAPDLWPAFGLALLACNAAAK